MKSSKGVTKRKNRWRAQAWNGETMLYLGSFLTEEEAVARRREWEETGR